MKGLGIRDWNLGVDLVQSAVEQIWPTYDSQGIRQTVIARIIQSRPNSGLSSHLKQSKRFHLFPPRWKTDRVGFEEFKGARSLDLGLKIWRLRLMVATQLMV